MGFIDTLSYYADPNRNVYIGIVYAFLFFLLLCVIGYYIYTNDFLKAYRNPGTSDIPNSGKTKGDVAIMFFHVDWCPHCKTAKPVWDDISAKYKNEYVNDYKCKFLEYNLTEENEENKKITSDFNIEGYPTIKMRKGNDIIDFDAKITANSLEEFIKNVTED